MTDPRPGAYTVTDTLMDMVHNPEVTRLDGTGRLWLLDNTPVDMDRHVVESADAAQLKKTVAWLNAEMDKSKALQAKLDRIRAIHEAHGTTAGDRYRAIGEVLNS